MNKKKLAGIIAGVLTVGYFGSRQLYGYRFVSQSDFTNGSYVTLYDRVADDSVQLVRTFRQGGVPHTIIMIDEGSGEIGDESGDLFQVYRYDKRILNYDKYQLKKTSHARNVDLLKGFTTYVDARHAATKIFNESIDMLPLE